MTWIRANELFVCCCCSVLDVVNDVWTLLVFIQSLNFTDDTSDISKRQSLNIVFAQSVCDFPRDDLPSLFRSFEKNMFTIQFAAGSCFVFSEAAACWWIWIRSSFKHLSVSSSISSRLLTSPHVSSRLLTSPHVSSRLLTSPASLCVWSDACEAPAGVFIHRCFSMCVWMLKIIDGDRF